jgi:hypothetical protein
MEWHSRWIIALAVVVAMSLMGGIHQTIEAITYVRLDGESFLQTNVPDTVEVTADCAQPGHRLVAEIYLDLNDNGLVEANETLVQFAYLNDGIPTLQDEQHQEDIPGDDDAVVNGQLVHFLEIEREEYSFSTIPMQFVIKLTDEDRSEAQAVLRLLPPASQRPYIGGLVTETVGATPLDSMVVVAYQTSTEDVRVALSDENGRYALNVEAGEWIVFTWDLQNYYAPADSQTVMVSAQDSAVADFALAPYPAYITGKVDSSGGSPVPGVMVVAMAESFDAWIGWTQADGGYRLGVMPGIYDIYPLFLPSGYTPWPPSHLDVVVDSGETVSDKNFGLGRPPNRIEGRVTYQAGGGASGVTIRAFSAGGYQSTTITDEDGNYSLTVQTGSYILSAELEGYQVTYPVSGIYFNVTVELNQTVTGKDFVITPTGGDPISISGTVTYQSSGQPAEGVYAVIYNEQENSSLGWHFAETDTAGMFRFGDIIEGTWCVGVYEPGYQSEPPLRQATVFFGTSASGQDFELTPETSVTEGTASGRPSVFALLPNRPNPFNEGTLIAYILPDEGSQKVTLRIFNVLGQEVETLLEEYQGGGLHLMPWNARGTHGRPISSGIYFLELQAGNRRQVRKLVLLR